MGAISAESHAGAHFITSFYSTMPFDVLNQNREILKGALQLLSLQNNY